MAPVLQQLLPADLFAVFLIFVRVGGAMMLLPGFGEFYVMQRARLLLALLFAALLAPVLGPMLPKMPNDVGALVAIVGSEAVIGIFLGSIARILLAATDVAGTVVSLQLGLSAAQIFNPMAAATATITSTFYGVLGVLLIFLTNLHHVLLRGVVDSYSVFPPGVMPPLGDMTDVITRSVAGCFLIGMEMSAPFILLGMIFYIAIGVIGRLVPQLQILFVTQPLQIIGGLVTFGVVLAAGMDWFITAFAQQFAALTGL